jgi:nucleoside phosphorylase
MCHIGPIASGDKIIASNEVINNFREYWPTLIGVEMEAAGMARAISQAPNSPGLLVILGVSDLADESKGSDDSQKWRVYACDVAASYVIGFLKNAPVSINTVSR